MKLIKPQSEEKKDRLAQLTLTSVCFKVVASQLLDKRMVGKAQCLQNVMTFCKEKSIPYEDTLFSMAFNTAWGEISSFSSSKGDRLSLLGTEAQRLTEQKRFHSYVVTIAKYLESSKKELSSKDVMKKIDARGEIRSNAFNLAFEYLGAELNDENE
ncbi:MAG: hypothetical protein WCG48_04360 [Candidatus Berkelbacteria bacterium]